MPFADPSAARMQYDHAVASMTRSLASTVLLLLGCYSQPGSDAAQCNVDDDCPSGQTCPAGVCVDAMSATTSDGGEDVVATTMPGDEDTGADEATSTGAQACVAPDLELDGRCVAAATFDTVVQQTFADVEVDHPGTAGACLSVTCPPQTTVIGGGFFRLGVALTEARAVAEDNAFRICGDVVAGAPASRWNVFAQCAAVEGDLLYRVSETPDTIAADASECRTVNCPAGTTLIGGGGTWPSWWSISDMRPGSGWRICGTAQGAAAEIEFHTTCAVLADASTLVVDGEATALPSETQCATATCPATDLVLGGGAAAGEDFTVLVSQREISPIDKTWRGCARAPEFIGGQVFTSALCLQQP